VSLALCVAASWRSCKRWWRCRRRSWKLQRMRSTYAQPALHKLGDINQRNRACVLARFASIASFCAYIFARSPGCAGSLEAYRTGKPAGHTHDMALAAKKSEDCCTQGFPTEICASFKPQSGAMGIFACMTGCPVLPTCCRYNELERERTSFQKSRPADRDAATTRFAPSEVDTHKQVKAQSLSGFALSSIRAAC